MIRRLSGSVFYGWWIVVSGFFVQMLTAALLQRSYSAYVVLLREDFGWSKTALSGAYSLQQVENGLLGPLQGWIVDRFGPRANMRVGLVLFGVGFMLLSQVHSLLTFYLAFGMLAIGTSVSGFFPFTVTLVNWFTRRRARALSTVSLGFATGGLLVPIVAFSLEQFGWRATAFTSGVLIMAIGLPLVQLVRFRPEPYGMYPDGIPPVQNAEGELVAFEDGPSFTARQALRTPAFWLISFGHGSALLVVGGVNVHILSHLNESLGYSLGAASLVVTLMTAFQFVGMVIGGTVGDRFDKRLIAAGCMGLHAVGLLLVAYAVNLPMVMLFAVLHGTAWGLRGPMMAAIRADLFGTRSFGVILGFSSMVAMIGNIAGPLVAGGMADITGSYEAGFTVLAVLAGLGSIFFLAIRKPMPPDEDSDVPQTAGQTA